MRTRNSFQNHSTFSRQLSNSVLERLALITRPVDPINYLIFDPFDNFGGKFFPVLDTKVICPIFWNWIEWKWNEKEIKLCNRLLLLSDFVYLLAILRSHYGHTLSMMNVGLLFFCFSTEMIQIIRFHIGGRQPIDAEKKIPSRAPRTLNQKAN